MTDVTGIVSLERADTLSVVAVEVIPQRPGFGGLLLLRVLHAGDRRVLRATVDDADFVEEGVLDDANAVRVLPD
jgi:hypothetical protein